MRCPSCTPDYCACADFYGGRLKYWKGEMMTKISKVMPAVIDMPRGWYAGTSEEYMNIGGPFSTREEAIQEGRHSQEGNPFYICEAALHGWRAPDADGVMDAWVDDHDELWWDDGFGGFDGDPDAEVRAQEDLQTILNEWFQRHRSMLPTATAFCFHTGGEWIDQPATVEVVEQEVAP